MIRPWPLPSAPWRSPRPVGDAILHAQANFYLGIGYWDLGDYRRAIDCYRQTVASFDEAWHRERLGLLPARRGLPCCARRWPCRAGHVRRGQGIRGRGLHCRGGCAAASCGPMTGSVCPSARRSPRYQGAPSLLERAVRHLSGRGPLRPGDPWMAATLGAAYTLAGRVAEAVRMLTQAMEQTAAAESDRSCALSSLPG